MAENHCANLFNTENVTANKRHYFVFRFLIITTCRSIGGTLCYRERLFFRVYCKTQYFTHFQSSLECALVSNMTRQLTSAISYFLITIPIERQWHARGNNPIRHNFEKYLCYEETWRIFCYQNNDSNHCSRDRLNNSFLLFSPTVITGSRHTHPCPHSRGF